MRDYAFPSLLHVGVCCHLSDFVGTRSRFKLCRDICRTRGDLHSVIEHQRSGFKVQVQAEG